VKGSPVLGWVDPQTALVSSVPSSSSSKGCRRERPAPPLEPSATTRGRATSDGSRCCAAGAKGRNFLLDLGRTAVGTSRRFGLAAKHEFFKALSTVTASVFEDGHGERLLLGFAAAAPILILPRPGRGGRNSSKTRQPGDARQNENIHDQE